MADEQAGAGRPWGDGLLTEGVVLAVIPVAAIGASVLSEYGACCFYGIPAELITTSVWSVLQAVTIVVVLVATPWIAVGVSPAFWSGRLGLRWLVLLVLVTICVGSAVSPLLPRWALAYGLPCLVATSLVLWVALSVSQPFAFKVARSLQRFGLRATLVLFISLMALAAAYPTGSHRAEIRKFYPVLPPDQPGGRELVVLRAYGDNLVCSPLNTRARTFGPGLVVVNLSAEPRVRMDYRDVGPLTRAVPGGPATRPTTTAPAGGVTVTSP